MKVVKTHQPSSIKASNADKGKQGGILESQVKTKLPVMTDNGAKTSGMPSDFAFFKHTQKGLC